MKEYYRKAVHIAGFSLVIAAVVIGDGLALSLYAFTASLGLLLASYIVRKRAAKDLVLLKHAKRHLGKLKSDLERETVPWPFMGAFWFFFGAGLTFVLFPLNIAEASMTIVTIGDGFATIIGKAFGKHRLIGKKTLEGSLAHFVFSLSAGFFVPFGHAVIAALITTIAELIPDLPHFKKYRSLGIIDDNLLIPLVSGTVLSLVSAS
ncbi:MAG: hypothetical protein HYX24_03675 [Candidatus Aenigmarchaeota archaeon]|nr:hypothetical protein [Candidatus Aenigmarchaeota archaeon]